MDQEDLWRILLTSCLSECFRPLSAVWFLLSFLHSILSHSFILSCTGVKIICTGLCVCWFILVSAGLFWSFFALNALFALFSVRSECVCVCVWCRYSALILISRVKRGYLLPVELPLNPLLPFILSSSSFTSNSFSATKCPSLVSVNVCWEPFLTDAHSVICILLVSSHYFTHFPPLPEPEKSPLQK